ncbi:Vacuole membrane protein 1 [Acropora cervicornis]|uniref:Vacuole membrane protein 1 n=1 Tax=Acropora cervicornis TaxID=6130 RepID=A0AAD9QBH8_ACRCE|nr:Vacuole membrane protein 1 [Acropora cervicornis]
MADRSRRSSRRLERSPARDTESPSSFNSWTVVKLRKELKRRGGNTGGLKADLIARLELADSLQHEEMPENDISKHLNSSMDAGGTRLRDKMREGENHDYQLTSQTELVYESSDDAGITEADFQMQKKLDQKRRRGIVLWLRPIITLKYFLLELGILLNDYTERTLKHKKTVSLVVVTSALMIIAYNLDGAHQESFKQMKMVVFWWAYWVGLGILSSVGLGTGLHTFLLYLGPHIASVTLAAWECNSLDFPEPPYPDEIQCPEDDHTSPVNMWTIMSKVRVEAFMWGAGTAIGELPPYFMARAARLSGNDPDDEELEEVEELERLTSLKDQSLWTKLKKCVLDLVERVGFFGILVCASVPNPLFDLAGITCGHCLVPFWTFFGATLIGKAVIKMHIQKSFVILAFSKRYVEAVLSYIGDIPTVGSYIQKPFRIALEKQKEKLHRKPGQGASLTTEPNILAWIFEKVVIAMIIYFLLSIINSMAQHYAKRLDEKKRQSQKPAKGE